MTIGRRRCEGLRSPSTRSRRRGAEFAEFAAVHMSANWHCVTSNAGPHGGAYSSDQNGI